MLKNIFVPTDFSENAEHALDYAISLAQKFKLNIYVFNALMNQSQGGMMLSVNEVIKNERKAELEEMLVKIRPQLDDDVISGHVAVVHSAVDAICSEAEAKNANLIIMGTTGASGIKKMLWGSVASNVVRKTTIPVLTVPFNAPAQIPKNVTLAIDTQNVDYDFFLLPILNLLVTLEPKFTITHVEAENKVDKSKGVFKFFKNLGVDYQYKQLEGSDIDKALFKHVENEDTDLLCMINHKRNFFKRLTNPSMTQKFVMENKLPLLILHDFH